ncbi:MAG TPA: response regulator [Gaiellaceae bacterium]|nr:response regulator [Gaiellaceae bacterium]
MTPLPGLGRHVLPALVVEDDEGLRAYLVAVLEHHGFEVVAAGSAEEATALLRGRRAQLAVLDVGLPGEDGFAVADSLGDDVPVIIVTGDPVNAYAKARMRPDLRYDVLPKPFSPELFEHAVARATLDTAV